MLLNMKTTRVNFSIAAAQPLGGLRTTLSNPSSLNPGGPVVRLPGMMTTVSAALCAASLECETPEVRVILLFYTGWELLINSPKKGS